MSSDTKEIPIKASGEADQTTNPPTTLGAGNNAVEPRKVTNGSSNDNGLGPTDASSPSSTNNNNNNEKKRPSKDMTQSSSPPFSSSPAPKRPKSAVDQNAPAAPANKVKKSKPKTHKIPVTKLKIVQSPRAKDILLGRGNGVAKHAGNQEFRYICLQHRGQYQKAYRNEKGIIVEKVLQCCRDEGMRFLERRKINAVNKPTPSGKVNLGGSSESVWVVVEGKAISEKISQALRENKWGVPPPGAPQHEVASVAAREAKAKGVKFTSEPKKNSTAAAAKKKKKTTSVSTNKKRKRSPPSPCGPIETVSDIDDNDILFGRGSGPASHPGNQLYRQVVQEARAIYQASPRSEKKLIVKSVLNKIRKLGGRFLERTQNQDDDAWQVVQNDDTILEKISQALRENKWGIPPPGAPPYQVATQAAKLHAVEEGKTNVAGLKGAPGGTPLQFNKRRLSSTASAKSSSNGNNRRNSMTSAGSSRPGAAAKSPNRRSMALPVRGQQRATTTANRIGDLYRLKPGMDISVHWPLDDAWYKARVEERIQDFFFLTYDDSVTEWLDLTKNEFMILSSDKENDTAMTVPVPSSSSAPISTPVKFHKLRRSGDAWTPQEDELLVQVVDSSYSWQDVALKFPNRTAEEVCRRYEDYVNPGISNHALSQTELRQLLEVQAKKGCCWRAVSPFFEGRTQSFLRSVWRKLEPSIVNYLANQRDVSSFAIVPDSIGRFKYRPGELDGVFHAISSSRQWVQ